MKSGERPRTLHLLKDFAWTAQVQGNPAVPKHCCASVHVGMCVGEVARAEHWEKLPHALLIKALMWCEIVLESFPFHLSIAQFWIYLAFILMGCVGLILMEYSELVIHWPPQEQEWAEDLEFVLKCCVLKCQPCIKPSTIFGGVSSLLCCLC